MIVTCKECGKMYQIDPSKLKGKIVTSKCVACGNKMIISQPKNKDKIKKEADKKEPGKPRILGLRRKLIALFFVFPITLIIISGYLFIDQLNQMATLTGDEGSKMVTQMAEEMILEKCLSVARETKLYLDSHFELQKEDFNRIPEFVNIVMQKVGITGYTIIVERETEFQPEYIWIHPNKNLIGVDITDAMKTRLGDKWERWNAVRSKPHITQGYYLWFDNREKYCVGVPIEGTPYNIVASTYIDEFTQPVTRLQEITSEATDSTRQTVIIIIVVSTLLVGSISTFYGHYLTSRIIRLTKLANRISLGEINVHIVDPVNDEVGDLAQAISRMQSSIRMAIERLSRSN